MKRLLMAAIAVLFIGCSTTTSAVPPYSFEPIEQSEFASIPTPVPEFWENVPSLSPSPSPTPAPRATPRPVTATQRGWTTAKVTWYGPGLYCESDTLKGCIKTGREWHNGTACGQLYTKTILGVAHRTLPCGTKILVRYNGKEVTVPVIDRGPYTAGVTFDMSGGLCVYLDHCFTGTIQYRILR